MEGGAFQNNASLADPRTNNFTTKGESGYLCYQKANVTMEHSSIEAVDNLTGLPHDTVRRFIFEIDGIIYIMHACLETRESFREAVRAFIDAASEHRVNPQMVDGHAVREWAKQEGYWVHERGRVPDGIIEEYLKAHP